MAIAILTISRLRKSFGASEVLKGIDLSVNARELVFIIGPSGSGKSILLRCINRLEEPSGGSVHFDGCEVTAPTTDLNVLRRSMGMVFQSFNLYPHMTALGNVTLALRLVLNEARDQADALGPKIVLFDEPTSALDPELVGSVLAVMRDLKARGMTMLVVSHELRFARDASDRIVFMDQGQIVEEGPPSAVLGSPREGRTRAFVAELTR